MFFHFAAYFFWGSLIALYAFFWIRCFLGKPITYDSPAGLFMAKCFFCLSLFAILVGIIKSILQLLHYLFG